MHIGATSTTVGGLRFANPPYGLCGWAKQLKPAAAFKSGIIIEHFYQLPERCARSWGDILDRESSRLNLVESFTRNFIAPSYQLICNSISFFGSIEDCKAFGQQSVFVNPLFSLVIFGVVAQIRIGDNCVGIVLLVVGTS